MLAQRERERLLALEADFAFSARRWLANIGSEIEQSRAVQRHHTKQRQIILALVIIETICNQAANTAE